MAFRTFRSGFNERFPRLAAIAMPWLDELGQNKSLQTASTEMTIGEIAAVLGRRWRTLLIFGIAGYLATLLFILAAPPLYSASVLITAAEDNANSSQSSSTVSSFLRLGGIGGQEDKRFQNFLIQMYSVQTAERLDKDFGLLRKQNAKIWDPEHNTWKRPEGAFFAFKQFIHKTLKTALWSPPDASDVVNYLKENLDTSQTKTPNVYMVTLRNPDPKLVGPLLEGVLRETNAIIRDVDRKRAQEAEAYLVSKLSSGTVTSVDQRQALAQLLATEEQRLLLVNLRPNYASEPLDVITVSKGPVWPMTGLFLKIGPIFGIFVGVLFVVLRATMGNRAKDERISVV